MSLAEVRKRRLMTRTELVEKAGVSYDTIRNIESGENASPSEATVFKLARALECEPAEITSAPAEQAA